MDQLQRVLDTFEALQGLEEPDQTAALEALRIEDAALHRKVSAMLGYDAQPGALDTLTEHGVSGALANALTLLHLPEQLGPYRIVRELGRGGMGIVYEAEQQQPRRRVALKTLLPLSHSNDARRRFEVEVQALAQLLHPCIPQLYEAFEHEGRPVLAMELVQGVPLLEATRTMGRIAQLRLLARIADAVHAAHRGNVLHRDLKPANILVSAAGAPKVLDFGIATLDGERGTQAGTRATMSPEQLAGEAADARTDVYGLGVTAWQVLAGTLPIEVKGLTTEQVLAAKRRGPDTAGLSPSIDAVLAKCLAPDPDQRMPDASTLADELRRIANLRPVLSVPTPWPHRASLFLQRRGARLAGLALAASVTAVLLLSAQDARQGRIEARREAVTRAALDELTGLVARRGWTEDGVRDAIDAFVDAPEHRGTASLSRAWLWLAMEDPVQVKTQALGQAWVTATEPEQARQALDPLAAQLLEEERWEALESVLEQLPPTSHLEARQAVAAWRRQWTELASQTPSLFAPLVDALSRRVHVEEGQTVWRGRVVAGASTKLRMQDVHQQVQSEITLLSPRQQSTMNTSDLGVLVLPEDGEPTWWDGQTQRPVQQPVSNLYRDAERYGVGIAGGTSLRVRKAGGPWRAPLGPDQLGESFISDADVGDYNGDGKLDVAVAMRGWSASGVQVWSDVFGASPTLLHRVPGLPFSVRTVRAADGRDHIAYVGKPDGTLPLVPPGVPRPPSTLAILDLHGAEPVTTAAMAPMRTRAITLQRLDVDGDGLDDLAVGSRGRVGWLLRQDAHGTFHPLRVPELVVYGATNLDEDPADELFVADRMQRFVLGTGPVVAESPPPERPTPARVPAGVPDDLLQTWSRAETLAASGLVPEAISTWSLLGRRPGAVGRLALRRALEVHGSAVTQGVGSLDESPVFGEVAHRFAQRPDLTDEDRVLARKALREVLDVDALARLDGEQAVAQVIPARSPLAWSVADAASATIDPLDGSLLLDLIHQGGPTIALQLRRTEGPVDIELELDIEEHDWLAGIELRLDGTDFHKALRLGRGGGGPADNHRHTAWCNDVASPRNVGMHHTSVQLGPRTMGLTLDATSGRMRCTFGEMAFQQPLGAAIPDTLTLTLGSTSSSLDRIARMRVRLLQVRLAGVEVVLRDEPDPAWPLVQGELAATRLSLDDPDPWLAAAAAQRLGRHEQADLTGLTERQLGILLRRDAGGWSLPIQAARAAEFVQAWHDAWWIPNRYEHPWRRAALRHPSLRTLDLTDATARGIATARAVALLRDGQTLEGQVLLEDVVAHGDQKDAWRALWSLHSASGDVARAQVALAGWRRSVDDPFSVDDAIRYSSTEVLPP